jgi:hypothetical protein
MGKIILYLIFGILLLSSIGFVIAEENDISCETDEENPDCVCNDDEVRQPGVKKRYGPTVYWCVESDCEEDEDCSYKFEDHYKCWKPDDSNPDKGYCRTTITTTNEEDDDEGKPLAVAQKKQLRVQTTAELRQRIQQRKEELENETKNLGNRYKQKVFQNQNAVRLAVHSLLAMENRTGGIGKQISQIAREFNNSVTATINLEEKIQKRSRLVKFLVGGDEEAAEELEEETNKNEQKIQKLKQLKEDCDCEEEIKAIIQEQIENMEGEQIRLKKLAQAEKKIKGIFSWLRRKSD